MPAGPTSSTAPRLIDIVLRIEPPTATHHRKRLGRRRDSGRLVMFDDPQLVRAKGSLGLAIAAAGVRPGRPLDGPLMAILEFRFGGARAAAFHDAKPDLDNVCKTLADALARAGLLADDARIARLIALKDRVPGPGSIRVRLLELTGLGPDMEIRLHRRGDDAAGVDVLRAGPGYG